MSDFLKSGTGIIIIITLISAFLLGGYEASKTPEQRMQEAAKREQRECSDQTMAFVMANHHIETSLKSPTTAEFPYITDDGVRTNYLGDCTHEVWTYVDAQNSYGAKIREYYFVRLQKYSGSNEWRILNAAIQSR